MEDNKSVFKLRTLFFSLVILNWLICGYLMLRSNNLNDEGSIPDLCKIIFGSSCDKALTSPISWHLGFPLGGWGLSYFGLLGLLFSFRTVLIDRIVLILASLGVGVSIIQSAIILKADIYCPLCLVIHFINILILVTLITGIPKPIINKDQKINFSKSFLFRLSMTLLVLIFFGGLTEVGLLKVSFGKKANTNITEISEIFQKETVYDIPKNDSSPRLGAYNAPIQIIVFSSFQCPACKDFAPKLEKIQNKFGENICIIFKNFPLGRTCNPLLIEDMQPQACVASYAAVAAQRQNNFWEFHDKLFESNLEFDEQTLIAIAKSCKLNMNEWEADRKSEAVKFTISTDIKLADQIGINATPTVLINGRKVASLDESVITKLIQSELNKVLQ